MSRAALARLMRMTVLTSSWGKILNLVVILALELVAIP
jgi:hypothetical protein